MSRYVLEFISKLKIIFENHAIFRVWTCKLYGWENNIHPHSKACRLKKERVLCLQCTLKVGISTYYASFSDGISFKSIRIIDKRSAAVRHTFEGLINNNYKTNSHKNSGAPFFDDTNAFKLIPSKNGA